jgi:diacylglycerol kinase family enzyme
MRSRRLAAAAALLVGLVALGLAVALAIASWPNGISVLACLVLALVGAWYGVRHGGGRRAVAFAVAALALLGALALIVLEGHALLNLAVLCAFGLALVLARIAFRRHVALPPAPRPRRPVLFYNPLSGGGKAARFKLAEEARARGIEPVELGRGDDLRQLVREAVDGGADALAMAGGDGSQAIVAEIAAELDLPYACIPAGTRNHFALDLGVEREDVVGALDAMVAGGERRVDLGEVNGRVFVNNVSLGFYAEAVQQSGYRDAKLRTMLELAPAALGPDREGGGLRWEGPGGEDGTGAVALLVSNNVYRLTGAIGSGTRPHLDAGVLGLAAVSQSAPGPGGALLGVSWRQWHRREFTVDADGPVAAGIDGEAATLEPPLCFRSRRAALRVRIAPGHPGASPSAGVPDGLLPAAAELVRIAIGRPPGVAA